MRVYTSCVSTTTTGKDYNVDSEPSNSDVRISRDLVTSCILCLQNVLYTLYTQSHVTCPVVSDNLYTLWTLDTRQYDVSRLYILYKMDICINEFNVMRGRCNLIRWRFVTMLYKSIIDIVFTGCKYKMHIDNSVSNFDNGPFWSISTL